MRSFTANERPLIQQSVRFGLLCIFLLSGWVLQAQTQASDIVFQPVANSTNSIGVSWTDGTSTTGRVVVIKSAKGNFTPTSGDISALVTNQSLTYANAASNDQDPTTEVAAVVYVGAASGPINITGLAAGVKYFVQVYEYTGSLPTVTFVSATGTNNPRGFSFYTANGTFDVPADVTSIRTQAWGGGGGGGGVSNSTAGRAGGGGSGGAYNIGDATVAAGATGLTVTVGTGGTAGSANGTSATSGGNGNPSSFVSVFAVGGNGGGSVAGNASDRTGAGGLAPTTGTFNGGAGSQGDGLPAGGNATTSASASGGGGGSPGRTGNGGAGGTSGFGVAAGSAGANGGASGATGVSVSNDGATGGFPGAGGSGGYDVGNAADRIGGVGGGGLVILSFNDNTPPTATITRLTPGGQTINISNTSVTFRVTFNESVLKVNAADFSLGTTNTAAGTIGTVTPFGTQSKVFDVQVTGITGDGDLDLNFGTQDIVDISNNAFGGSTSGDEIYSRDGIAPSVVSIVPAQSPSRSYIPKTGTISSSTASTSVTGVGTSFTTELFPGAVLWDLAGVNAVGFVQSITSDTQLTLTANANSSLTNSPYSIRLYFIVTFSEPMNVSTVTIGDFVKGTGSAGGTTILSVGPVSVLSGPPITAAAQSTAFNVSVSTSGDGTWRLDKTSDAYSDVAGNSATATFTTGSLANIDNTPPTVTSIVRKTPAAAFTQATSVTYTVTFAEAVTGVDASDFSATVTGVTAGAITVTPVSATIYDVDVASISTVNGTLRLDVNANASITDGVGNNFGSTAYTGGQVYTFDYNNPAQPATYNAGTLTANVVANYWNSHNTAVRLPVSIPSNATDPSLLGGSVQVEARISSGTFATIASTSSLTITGGDQGNTKNIDIDAAAITAITGYAQGVQLEFQVRFVDLVGNTGTFRQSTNALTVDTVKPTINGTPTFALNANGRETIVLNFSETLALTNGVMPVRTATNGQPGFYSNQPFIRNSAAQTFYTSVGNTITLSSDADNNWDNTVQITYTADVGVAGNYVRDAAGNEMSNVTFPVVAPAPLILRSMVLNPNGAGPEIIAFAVDQALNTSTAANAVTGITVDPDGAGPTPAGAISGTYSTTGNTITLQSAANGQWSTATTVSYSGGNLAGTSAVAMAAFGPEPILLTVSIASNNPFSTALAKQGETITLTINASTVLPLSGTPTATIGGLAATVSGSNPYTATVTTDGTVPQGNVAFTINALQAGRSTNVSFTTNGSSVSYDNILPIPNPPAPPDLATGSDNGFSTSDNITGISAGLVFQGAAGSVEANSTVIVRDNTTQLNTVTAAGDGSWTYTHVAALSDGVHPINIISRDAAGNLTSASTNLNVTVDTSAPTLTITRGSTTNSWSSTGGTTASSVDFTVTFSDVINVSSLTAADFGIASTGSVAGASITNITPAGNSNTYTVTVGGYTGTGTLGLNYIDNNDGNEARNIVDLFTASGLTGATYSIVLPEPNSQAITVTAPTVTGNSITLNWNGTNTSQVPTHYLVLAVLDGNSFPTVEELDQSAHYAIADGPLAMNVVRSGGGTHSVSFTGLPSGTTYDFRVYKYTKSANYTIDNIDYEMSNPGVLDNIITITAPFSSVVLNSTAATIGSTKDNNPITERASVLQFTIFDDGQDPLVPNIMSLQPNGLGPETITLTLRGEITLSEGASVTGFTSSTGSVLTAIYTGKNTTNTITLTNSGANGTWTTGTTISYNSDIGNVQFTSPSLGKMQHIIAHSVSSVPDVVVQYNAPGFNNFVVPAGVTQITVETWGAGGSGGPVWNSATVGGASSGGGGGGYSRRTISVTPGANYTTFVGTGGAAALGTLAYVQAGNDGEDTYFGNTSLVLAKGGQGGWNNDWTDYYGTTIHANSGATRHGLGGDATLGVGDVKYSGGDGGYGYDGGAIPGHNASVFGSGGGGGSSAGNGIDGNNGANGGSTCNGCGVLGGSAPTGGASGGIGWNGLAGNPGNFPGGGGGGTSQFGPFPSGAGGSGRIVITHAGAHPTSGGTSDWVADDAPFRFNQLVISQGDGISPSLTADWSTVIAGAELTDGTNSITTPANGTINPTNITFTLPSDNSSEIGFINDANGSASSKTYTLKVWLKDNLNNALASSIDGLFLDFKVLPALQASVTNDDDNNQRSSRIVSGHPDFQSGASEITVDATKLVFSKAGNPTGPLATDVQPSIGVGIPFSSSSAPDAEVYALDANNNLDLDYNKTNLGISNTLSFGQSTNLVSFTNGKVSLNPFSFTTGSPTLSNTVIQVTDPALPNPTASSSNIWPRISTLTTITEGPTVPASELASFNSTTVSAPAAFNFDFSVVDDNGADPNAFSDNDALPTLIQNITITQGANNGTNSSPGPNNDATTFDDWTKSLAGARLQSGLQFIDISTTASTSGVITANQLSFNIPAGTSMENVANDGTKTYQLKVWMRTQVDTVTGVGLQNILDNKDYSFAIDVSNITLNSSNPNATSQKAGSGSASTADGRNQVQVHATKLKFTTQPAASQSYDSPITPIPVVKAVDANGNVDLGYTGTPLLTTQPNAGPVRTYPFLAGTDVLNNTNGLVTFDNVGPDVLTITSLGNGTNGDVTRMIVTGGLNDLGAGVTAAQSTSFVMSYSNESVITKDPSFTSANTYASGNGYPEDILYANYQAASFSANTDGVALERFLLKDGGNDLTDPDGTPTKLQSITLNISNWQYLKTIAIYSGSTKIAERAVTAVNITNQVGITGDLVIPSLLAPFQANDPGSGPGTAASFTVFATFQSSVVAGFDNAVVEVRVNGATVSSTSSRFTTGGDVVPTFAPLNAGQNENKLEVQATQLVFSNPITPQQASIDSDFQPGGSPVQVIARDAFGNQDADYTGTISVITNTTNATMEGNGQIAIGTAGSGITYNSTPFTGGVFTFPGSFQFTTGNNNDNVTLTVNSSGPISGTSPTITLLTSSESAVLLDPTFSYTANVDYHNYPEPTNLSNSNSFELARLLLVDGSRSSGFNYTSAFGTAKLSNLTNNDGQPDTDADGAPTRLDSLVLRVTNPANIRRIALYDSAGNEVAVEIPVNVAQGTPYMDFKFGATSMIVASDNQEAAIRVRASFWNDATHVIDNQEMHVTVLRAKYGNGSKFSQFGNAAYIAGVLGGYSAPALVNVIEVTATSLDFMNTGVSSTVVGKDEPIGKNALNQDYVSSPLVPTVASIVHARDINGLVDLDVFDKPTVTSASGPVMFSSGTPAFNAGIIKLDGLQYSSAGNGLGNGKVRVQIISKGLDSNLAPNVDVVHVDAVENTIGVSTNASLKGGTGPHAILGFTFKVYGNTTAEPFLKSYAITFKDKNGLPYPYKTATGQVFRNFRIMQSTQGTLSGSTDITGSVTLIPETTVALPAGSFDRLKIVFGGAGVNLHQKDVSGKLVEYTYYINVDVDVKATGSNPVIQPFLEDGGYSNSGTNTHIVTSSGTATAAVIGKPRSFSSTKVPELVYSYPAIGQLNVDPDQDSVSLVFDVKILSLDSKIELWDKATNSKLYDLTVGSRGKFISPATLSTQVIDTIRFGLPASISQCGHKLCPDSVYFIKIAKGEFSNTAKIGLMDDQKNLYGGISFSGAYYFKAASKNPPKMISTEPLQYAFTQTTSTLNAAFDQKGKAYVLVTTGGPSTLTAAEVISGPISSGSFVHRQTFDITEVSPKLQFMTLNVGLSPANTYEVYIVGENDALPSPIIASAIYGDDVSKFKIGASGPTLVLKNPSQKIGNFNIATFQICANNSIIRLDEPIQLFEQTKSEFNNGSTIQTINLILPSGFQFDGTRKPKVDFIGSDFDNTQDTLYFVNSTILRLQFVNNNTSSLDNIIISDMYVSAASASASGDIVRFGGNGLTALIPDNTKVATINAAYLGSTTSFSNSYSLTNATDFNTLGVKDAVNYIPSNFVDADGTETVRLLPIVTKGDYGANIWSGSGLTDDVLSLTAATKDAALPITLNHTDANGCKIEIKNQYQVYTYTRAIPQLLSKRDDIRIGLRNLNLFNNPNPSSFNPPIDTLLQSVRKVTYDFKSGFQLLNLTAKIPDRVKASRQVIDFNDLGWQNIVKGFPVFSNLVNDPVVTDTTFSEFKWDYTGVLDNSILSSNAVINPYEELRNRLTNPGDLFTNNKTPFYKGGKIGTVEYTGLYRSTADFTLYVPFKQEVDLYLAPIPMVEIDLADITAYDAADMTSNDPAIWANGLPVFCEKGAPFTITGYPKASPGTSKGYFYVVDAMNNADTLWSKLKPYGGFVDNGNGTATLTPDDFLKAHPLGLPKKANAYNSIRIGYVYQDDDSPISGKGDLVIKITPNPTPLFTYTSVYPEKVTPYVNDRIIKGTAAEGRADKPDGYCEDNTIRFINKSTFPITGYQSNFKQIWDMGEPQSGRINQDTVYYTYKDPGKYDVTFSTQSQFGCTSGNILIPITVGPLPSPNFEIRGVSTATDVTVTDITPATEFINGVQSNKKIARYHFGQLYTNKLQVINQDKFFYKKAYRDSLFIDSVVIAKDPTLRTFKHKEYTPPSRPRYDTTGIYTITMLSRTDLGCARTISKEVIILPSLDSAVVKKQELDTLSFIKLDSARKYRWITDGKAVKKLPNNALVTINRSSWVRGKVNKTKISIDPAISPDDTVWYIKGKPNGDYFGGVTSYLYTGVYDISKLNRPMISLDYADDMKLNDGTVLEYSLDNKNPKDSTKQWFRLGTNSTGFDWYNAFGLASIPGTQLAFNDPVASGNYGWSNTSSTGKWTNARHALTRGVDIPAATDTIMFRLVFATLGDSLRTDGAEGFALDNFRIGERTRVVLVENFTNTGNSAPAELTVSNYFENTFFPSTPSVNIGKDAVLLQYHVGFPDQDPFNLDNPSDASSRALYYGVSTTPSTRLDGNNYATQTAPTFNLHGQAAYDDQTLKLASAEILIKADTIWKDGSYWVKPSIIAREDLPAGTIVYVVLAEESTNESEIRTRYPALDYPIKSGQTKFRYVVKKMLPSASGTRLSTSLPKGDTLVLDSATLTWAPDPKTLYGNNNDMRAIIFVQNESTREVYQAGIFNLNKRLMDPGPVITGIESPFNFKDIAIYPNPADQELNIVFPNALEVDVPIVMADQMGRITHNVVAKKGEQALILKTDGVSQGLYILQINMGEGKVGRSKVIINHKE